MRLLIIIALFSIPTFAEEKPFDDKALHFAYGMGLSLAAHSIGKSLGASKLESVLLGVLVGTTATIVKEYTDKSVDKNDLAYGFAGSVWGGIFSYAIDF